MENIFSIRLRPFIKKLEDQWDHIQEIRMRNGRPLIIIKDGREWMPDSSGKPLLVLSEDIQETVAYICQYSLYAFEDELRQGYITIRGGHRVGIAGQVSIVNGKVKSFAHISSLNIRVAHSVVDCGVKYFAYLWQGGRPCHTLIVSPPGCGKTTLLRDFVRLFSNGRDRYSGVSVGLVDERSEVGACYRGVPQNDIGLRTDVLDNCPKNIGIEMMVRSMAPAVIAFDELGGQQDLDAAGYAIHCGCSVLTTMHGSTETDVRHRCGYLNFERYIYLNDWKQKERVRQITDQSGQILYKAV